MLLNYINVEFSDFLSSLLETWVSVSKQPGGEALFPLIDCFTDVLLAIGVALSQLTDIIKAGLRVKDLFSFFFSDSFRAGYDRYKINIFVQMTRYFTFCHATSPWRNRLARSAVNRKVGGSSPPGDVIFGC